MSEILLNQPLLLPNAIPTPRNPFPIQYVLNKLLKWPNIAIIYMADCCRENSKKLDLLSQFPERDPIENERLKKALGLTDIKDVKVSPWEQLKA